jgi:hypothetical protein
MRGVPTPINYPRGPAELRHKSAQKEHLERLLFEDLGLPKNECPVASSVTVPR